MIDSISKALIKQEVGRAVEQLQNPEISSEEVLRIYKRWIFHRSGPVVFLCDNYVVPIEVKYLEAGVLHESLPFPKAKLTEEQIRQLELYRYSDEKADEYILQEANSAAEIAFGNPFDIGFNEIQQQRMINNIATTYGYKIDEAVVTMLLGISGASFADRLLPFFQSRKNIAIAAGVTYAFGKMAKAYFASGMSMESDELRKVFTSARKEADTIDWMSRLPLYK